MADKKDEALDEDLESLQLKINEKSDETLESTRRMREMCAEAKDAGMKTLIALDDQEELIDKFEEAADGINADMALAEKALKVGRQHGSLQDKCCHQMKFLQHLQRGLPSHPIFLYVLQYFPSIIFSFYKNIMNIFHRNVCQSPYLWFWKRWLPCL